MHPCLFVTDRKVTIESPDTKVALIELFTSEGRSSCPRAEAWFGALKGESGLWKNFVPVAFHVDYWNHLGWSDRFSSEDLPVASATKRRGGMRQRFIRPSSCLTARNGGEQADSHHLRRKSRANCA